MVVDMETDGAGILIHRDMSQFDDTSEQCKKELSTTVFVF